MGMKETILLDLSGEDMGTLPGRFKMEEVMLVED